MIARWTARVAAAAACLAMAATPALAASPNAAPRHIAFYGDIGNLIGSRNPLLVRPSQLLLVEDGSVALVHLHWRDWGKSVAHATGTWSASSCDPSCATGKLTNRPARLTLSSPGTVAGHLVYRCFRIDPPHPRRDILDHACIRGHGTDAAYASVTGG